MKKAIVVLSGGQDSTTCLFHTLADEFAVKAVTFNYGQRHQRELEAANRVYDIAAKRYPEQMLGHEMIDLGAHVLAGTSPLVSANKLEQYADHSSLPGGIEKTFVPLRNQLFLTIAANRAVEIGATVVVTGVCEEDYGGYPDCRRVFIDALQNTINLSNEGAAQPILIDTPLMFLTKAQSVDMAVELSEAGHPAYEALAWSHTAYDGQFPPLGKDHATLLRAKGFEEADVPDPLVLRAVLLGVMGMPETKNYRNPDAYMHLAGLLPPKAA